MDFLLLAHLLDGFVIDLVHVGVGERFLADRLQQRFHQQLVAGEGELALEVGAVAELLGLGGFRHQDHVGHELHQVVLLGLRRHRRNLAGLFLGDGEVALVDFGAVDLGHQRVLVLGAQRRSRHQQQGQGGEQRRQEPAKMPGPAAGEGRVIVMTQSFGAVLGNGSVRNTMRTAADLSPNNHGFAMADWR